MLNNSGKSGHPCLIPDLRGNAFSFSPLRMMFAVGLLNCSWNHRLGGVFYEQRSLQGQTEDQQGRVKKIPPPSSHLNFRFSHEASPERASPHWSPSPAFHGPCNLAFEYTLPILNISRSCFPCHFLTCGNHDPYSLLMLTVPAEVLSTQ